MNIVIRYIITALLFTINIPALFAQDSLTYALGSIAVVRNGKEIHIGEQVPDLTIDKMVNYKATSVQLHSFTGKPLIIEFWHQFCPVCRAEFPKLDQLKKTFGDQLNILLVTFQSKTSVLEFLQEQKALGKPVTLPSVVEDTLLRKTFAHDGDPHLVWIGKDGTVDAITSHMLLTEDNIRSWLQKGFIQLPVKNMQKDFDLHQPLLVNNNGGAPGAFQYRSMLTGFIDSITATHLIQDFDSSRARLFMSNATIDQLFKELFINYDTVAAKYLDLDWLNKRMVIEYSDSSVTANWISAYEKDFAALYHFQQKHMYCYELILPPSFNRQQALQYMLEDLQRLFHVNASIELCTINGLALIRQDKEDRIKTKGGKPGSYRINNDSIIVTENRGMWSLVNILNLNYNIPLVRDETGYTTNIDIKVPFLKNDLDAVRSSLQEYGLDLIPKKYTLPVLVLRNK